MDSGSGPRQYTSQRELYNYVVIVAVLVHRLYLFTAFFFKATNFETSFVSLINKQRNEMSLTFFQLFHF